MGGNLKCEVVYLIDLKHMPSQSSVWRCFLHKYPTPEDQRKLLDHFGEIMGNPEYGEYDMTEMVLDVVHILGAEDADEYINAGRAEGTGEGN